MNKPVAGIEPLCPTNSSYLWHNLWTRTSQREEEEKKIKTTEGKREKRESRITFKLVSKVL